MQKGPLLSDHPWQHGTFSLISYVTEQQEHDLADMSNDFIQAPHQLLSIVTPLNPQTTTQGQCCYCSDFTAI